MKNTTKFIVFTSLIIFTIYSPNIYSQSKVKDFSNAVSKHDSNPYDGKNYLANHYYDDQSKLGLDGMRVIYDGKEGIAVVKNEEFIRIKIKYDNGRFDEYPTGDIYIDKGLNILRQYIISHDYHFINDDKEIFSQTGDKSQFSYGQILKFKDVFICKKTSYSYAVCVETMDGKVFSLYESYSSDTHKSKLELTGTEYSSVNLWTAENYELFRKSRFKKEIKNGNLVKGMSLDEYYLAGWGLPEREVKFHMTKYHKAYELFNGQVMYLDKNNIIQGFSQQL